MAELPPFLRDVETGCSITVKVHPRARRCGVSGVHGDALKLDVAAAPEGGAANAEVEALLAGLLGVARGQVSVAVGAGSRRKVVIVRGVGAAEAARALVPPAR